MEKTIEYSGGTFQIRLETDTIAFYGSLEKTVYAEVADFLKEAEAKMNSDTVILDLRSLEFLNSTGIRMFAVFLTGSAKKFHILLNSSITWQKTTLFAIQQIKPSAIHISEY